MKILLALIFGALVLSAQRSITTNSPLPSGVANALPVYSLNFTTDLQGTYNWSETGALPPGLTLDPSGLLSGTPTTPGTFSFTVAAKNVDGGGPPAKQFTLTVLQPLIITPTSFPPGVSMDVYRSVRLMTSGGTPSYQYTVQPKDPFTQTTLPPGMDLSSNGVLSGTPLQSGVYPFNITVTDSTTLPGTEGTGYFVQEIFSITIVDQLVITTAASLPAGATNNSYSQSIVAMGGQSPYTFKALQTLPPGLTLDPVSGLLGGVPTMPGSFSFNVQVDDSIGFAVSKVFQLVIAAGMPPLQANPTAFSFTAAVGGDLPPPQALNVIGTGTTPIAFATQVDGGQPNTMPQFSLTVSPSSGMTPGGLELLAAQTDPQANPLPAGQYSARVLVSMAGTAPGSPVAVPVTLTVVTQGPQLAVAPAALNFVARRAAPGTFKQTLVLHNAGGGGAVNVTASVDIPVPWITDVSPSTGATMPNQSLLIQVTVSTAGLPVGGQHSSIKLSYSQGSTSGVVNVPISLFVADAGPILGVDVVGQRFETQQGNSTSEPAFVNIFNFGDPTTTVNWTAEADVVSGGAWLSLSPTTGTATATNPGMLILRLNSVANSLAAGGYYALVKITDSLSQNSPQYVAVILDIASAARASRPAPVPEGIVFRGVAGGAAPASQNDIIHTSSSAPVAFQASTSTDDGMSWLSVSPTSGQTSTASPAQVTISTDQTGLQAGAHTGRVNIALGAELRSVNVTLIVVPAGSTAGRQQAALMAAGCTPTRLVVTQTGLTNSFAVPAGWPETISVAVNDDCGNVVNSASVASSFSNGDPALSLQGDQRTGTYTATWQPGTATAETTVAVQATSSPLQPGTTKITGGVAPNIAPVLAKGGTVNAFFRTSGALAAGTVSEVYGTGLASGTVLAQLPLPNQINNTAVLIGGKQPPLFFVSKGQLDIELPPELQPGRQYNIIVNANGALTLPDTIIVNAAQPGVGSFLDGAVTRTLAQHSNGSLVKANNPAKPGEVLVVYLLGMGATNPAVKSGQQAPSAEPLARVVVAPTLTVNGETAKIFYAGLTPGSIGLYQINFEVPKDAPSGDLDVVLTQNGAAANKTELRVAK